MFGIGRKKEAAQAAPADASVAPADALVAPAAAAPAVEMQPAGFWLRVVALIVDYGVLLLLLAVLFAAADSLGGEEMVLPAYWLWILVTFLYWPVLESTPRRGTLGKMALGLVVGDIDGGGLNFVRSLLRNLAKIISSIPLGIGFVLAAFTARKQALHDLITKSVVMRRGKGNIARTLGALVAGIALIFVGNLMTADQMMGTVMKEMEAMMGGGVAQPYPAPMAKPQAKPAAPAPVAAAKPAPAPAPAAAASAPQPQAAAPKPAAAPAQVAQAPAAKPALPPKPAATTTPPAAATGSTSAAKPAPAAAAPAKSAPAAAAKPASAAADKPASAAADKPAGASAAAPASEPEPVRIAAAPKPEPTDPKPAPAPAAPPRAPAEPMVPLARPGIAAQPGPRFNDVMTAVLYRDRETVSQLVAFGRWLDKRDSNGLTPLMIAAGHGDAEMVRLLLQSGADPRLQAPGGATALDFALERGDAQTTQLLQRQAPR